MNLRGFANAVSNIVNPNIRVSVQKSNGYTMGVGQRQVPAYAPAVVGFGQLQALDSKDLKQLDGLNIQGTIKAIYLYGILAGVVRPDSKGGDLITFGGQTWLVVKVLEGWSDWTKCAIVLQDS